MDLHRRIKLDPTVAVPVGLGPPAGVEAAHAAGEVGEGAEEEEAEEVNRGGLVRPLPTSNWWR